MQPRTKKLFLALPFVLIFPFFIYFFWLYFTAPHFSPLEFGSDFKAHVVYYGHEVSPPRTIIIIPPTGGINILDKLYAHSLWKAGCDVYILTAWSGSDESGVDLQSHQRFYTSSKKAVGLIIDKIKSPFIGVLGTSVGGLHTAVSMGTHDRLSSALVITAGVPIIDVVVNSSQKAMVEGKKKRYEMYHFKNDDEYLAALNEAFLIDAVKLPHKFAGKKMGVVIAEHDTTVPTVNQKKLQKFWNAEVVSVVGQDHFYAIVKTALFDRDKVVTFFTTP